MEGVMTGRDMQVFVDLADTAIKRHPPHLDWVLTWTKLPTLKPLTPKGWYEEGHGITGGTLDSHLGCLFLFSGIYFLGPKKCS